MAVPSMEVQWMGWMMVSWLLFFISTIFIWIFCFQSKLLVVVGPVLTIEIKYEFSQGRRSSPSSWMSSQSNIHSLLVQQLFIVSFERENTHDIHELLEDSVAWERPFTVLPNLRSRTKSKETSLSPPTTVFLFTRTCQLVVPVYCLITNLVYYWSAEGKVKGRPADDAVRSYVYYLRIVEGGQ